MPPKRDSGPPRRPLPLPSRREELVRILYNRIAHPLPPEQPEVFDQAMARDLLGRTRYDVDLAERRWRHYSARMRARREAAEAAANAAATPAPPPPPPPPPQQQQTTSAPPQATGNDQAGEVQPDPDGEQDPAAPSTGSEHGGQDPTPGSERGEDDPEPPVPLDPELLAKLEKSRLPFSSGEQEVRDAALAFREAIREQECVRLSISEAILLLFLAGGDIGVALADFTSHAAARRRLRYNFDGLRVLQDVEDLIQESKCLQVLTEITRRTDWLSLKLLLQRKKWNLVKVIIRWFKKGIPVFDDKDVPRDKPNGWGLRGDRWARKLEKPSEESTKPATSDFTGWAPDGDNFTNPDDPEQPEPHIWGEQWRKDMEELKKPPSERDRYVRDYRGRQPGFLLNFDPAPLKPGPLAPSDFRLEWFQKGRYWLKIFNKAQFDLKRPESPSEASSSSAHSSSNSSGNSPPPPPGQDPVEFNTYDPTHIGVLNRWRTSTRWNAGQELYGEHFQKWTQAELDQLYQLQSDRLAEYKKQYPWLTRRELLEEYFQIPYAKKLEWEKTFNSRFEGTICAGEKFPRRARKAGGMIEHRTRFPRLATHFRVPLNKEYAKKLSAAAKQDIVRYEQERDAMEAADEQATMDWNEANPTTDGKPRPTPPPKPVGNQPDRAKKRKQRPSSSPPASGDGNSGQYGSAGGGGGGGAPGAGSASGAGAGAATGRGRGGGRGGRGTGPPRRGGRGAQAGNSAPRRGGRGVQGGRGLSRGNGRGRGGRGAGAGRG